MTEDKRYGRYCLAVALGVVALKVWLGRRVPATAMMADDYENLNRSIYVLHGDLGLRDYPFSKIAYGPLYPLVVSPWLLFDDPATRLQVVFAINAVLSGVAVVFGSLTVHALSGTASRLVPLCLAAWAPLFQYSFYAVTENLLLPMLLVVGWLAVDFAETCRRPARLALLVALALLLPLVRVPGLAVVPALLALVWLHRTVLFGRRAARLATALALVLPVAAYLVVYRLFVGSDREEQYLAALATVAAAPRGWLFVLELAASQVRYLFLATGYWVLPLAVVAALQVGRAAPGPARTRWVNHLVYAGVAGAGLLAFALVHLALKQAQSFDGSFIYGRYDDPTGLLLLVTGLAGVLALRPLTGVERVLLRVVAPVALCVVLGGGMLTRRWAPINEAGLSILAMGTIPLRVLLLLTVAAVSVTHLADEKRRLVPAALGFLLVFGALANRQGMTYTIGRARLVADNLRGSEWIAAHVPPDARLGYDGYAIYTPARGLAIRSVGDVFRSMVFGTHPRTPVLVDSAEKLARVDYLYSTAHSTAWTRAGGVRLTPVWGDDPYVLYRVSPALSAR